MSPRILFAHGAGAGSDHPWMQAWAQRLSALGAVHTFDYPYKAAGRRAPDRMPKLLAAHRAQVDALPGSGPVVLCGKSMGSRVGCHSCRPLRTRSCVGSRLHVERRLGPMQWLDRAAVGLGQGHGQVRLAGG